MGMIGFFSAETNHFALIACGVFSVLSLILMTYSLLTWWWRGRKIKQKMANEKLQSYNDPIGLVESGRERIQSKDYYLANQK